MRNSPDDKFSFVNAFQSAEPGRNFAELPRWSPQQDDLQAQVMRQVRVHHRDNQIMMVVLELHELVAELTPMMIIHQRQCPHDIFRIFDPCPSGQRVVDELANRLAAGGKTLFAAVSLKPLQKVSLQRNGKADDL